MATAVFDGRYGVRAEVPAEWRLVDQGATHATWDAPGCRVVAERRSAPLLVDPFLLEDYRLDLRFAVGGRDGGLVECDLWPGIGVCGVTKEPTADRERSAIYAAHVLVPTRDGHLALELTAEGDAAEADARDASVLAALAPGGGLPPDWSADPYGYAYALATTGEVFRHAGWAREPLLRCRSDDARYDAHFPTHPLSLLRAALAALRARVEVTEPSPLRVPAGTTDVSGVHFELPIGFLPAPRRGPQDAQRFVRESFGEQRSALALRWHADPKAGSELGAAVQAVARWLEDDGLRLDQGPRLVPRDLGVRRGMFLEVDARGLDNEPRYLAGFLVPWAGRTLELDREGPLEDWERAGRDLEAAVRSLSALPDGPQRDTRRALELLSPNGRRRIYSTLVWLANADGYVHPREQALLEGYRLRLQLDPRDADLAAEEVKGTRRLRVGHQQVERDLLLRAMVSLVAADGVLHPAEEKRVRKVADAIGIPMSEVLERIRALLASGEQR